jgi:hypothetical protein
MNTLELAKHKANLLTEIGDSPTQPYEWEQVIFDEDHRAYNFSTSPDPNKPELGTYYEVNLNQMEPVRWDLPDEENGPSLAVEFGVIDQQGHKSIQTLTNKGEMYRVLSTVADIVKSDLEEHDYIKTLEFVPSQRLGKDTDKSNARLRIYTQYIIKQLGNSIDPKTAITNGSSGTTYVDLPKKKLTEIGDASKQPYGPIDTITDDEAERQYVFETESGTIYEVKVDTFYRGPGRPVIARVNFGTIGEEGDISYDTQTGENDIYRIMSTIVQIVKKDLKSNHADIIEFSPSKRAGDKDKDPMSNVRTKLYSRYIKGQFPNAKVTKTLLGDIQVKLT